MIITFSVIFRYIVFFFRCNSDFCRRTKNKMLTRLRIIAADLKIFIFIRIPHKHLKIGCKFYVTKVNKIFQIEK